jgi:hypothetical protein
MTAIMRHIEEMEQKENAVKAAVKAGPCFTQVEGRVGHGNEKVGEKCRLRDACDAGGEGTGQGQRPSTSRVASKAKAKRRLWRRESVPRPRKPTWHKSSIMKKE